MTGKIALVALCISLAEQVLLTVGGQIAPDASRLYGAPLPVGSGIDLIGLSSGTFDAPTWIINLLITIAIVWALAAWLGASLARGLIAVVLATVAGIGLVAAGHEWQLFGWDVRQLSIWSWSQLVVWLLGLVAVALTWSGRPGSAKIGSRSRIVAGPPGP